MGKLSHITRHLKIYREVNNCTCYHIHFVLRTSNNIIFVSLNLRVPSKHEILAFRLLNLANSTLNPLVYAFLKDDIKRESKALLCRKRKLKLRPFQVHPE